MTAQPWRQTLLPKMSRSIDRAKNYAEQANARTVADPGACVTIARQPPFFRFRSAPCGAA
jgi:hypothetical protein